MSETKTVQVVSSGFPIASVLTIIFVIAKLAKVIYWSWLWVLSPLWIGAALGIGMFLIVLVVAILIGILTALFER